MLMSFFFLPPRYKQANLLLAARGRAQAAPDQQEGWAGVVGVLQWGDVWQERSWLGLVSVTWQTRFDFVAYSSGLGNSVGRCRDTRTAHHRAQRHE